MSEPHTYNELMRWFGTDHKAGLYDLHGLSLLVDHAPHDIPAIWNYVLDYRLLSVSSPEFWITPKGKVWNVAWAMHEMLITHTMGMSVEKTEMAGWMRVSKGNAMHRTKATRVQLETLAVLRPDIQAKVLFDRVERRVPYPEIACYDVAPAKLPWTIWVEDIDARPE